MNKKMIGALALGIAILSVAILAAAWSFESSEEAKADFCGSLNSLETPPWGPGFVAVETGPSGRGACAKSSATLGWRNRP